MRTGLVIPLLMGMAAPAFAQDSLPFAPAPSGSVAGPTMQESTYSPQPAVQHLPANAPNIVIIMLDDIGYAIPSTFGGDVETPTLTRLAGDGIAYNAFHNAAMCSPTRAALLTGHNHHRVGFGQIAELANDWDGYTGMWPATSASVAKVLGYYGYSTAAFGKWHNTPAEETTAAGPFDRWPAGRLVGFDYFYGFLAGESSQWEPAIVENTTRIHPPVREGYHFTEDMTDQAVRWMREQRALAPDRPFFLYWAPGGAHGPHHIFKEWADRYAGKFDDGWDAMRERIFARQLEMGWIPEGTELTPRPESLTAWADIPDDERAFQLRLMEVFAGYVEHTDTQAGRIIDELDSLGVRGNTLVFYIFSDNGSSAEGQNGTISELLAQNSIATKISEHIEALDKLGGLDVLGSPLTDNMYHAGWAWAGSTPFRSTKLVAAHFGGTRTPMVISWPAQIAHDATPRPQFHHVNDIAPTIYDILGIEEPKLVDGVSQEPLDGISMAYTFESAIEPGRKGGQYFEVMGSRAMYQDGWIASVFGPRIPWLPGVSPDIVKWNPQNDQWELYDLATDFSQANDIAAENPEQTAELVAAFEAAAIANRVNPVGGGLWSILNPQYAPQNPATEFFYTQDVTGVPEFAGPKVGARSNLVTIKADLAADSAGVLYAVGGFSGGLSVWIENGAIVYEYNLFEIERTQISSTAPLPTGPVTIEVESTVGKGRGAAVDVVIRVNGEEVASGQVPRSASLAFTANDTFDVGTDSYSPVSLAYNDRAPFTFNGSIESLHVQYKQ
ncbi:MAG: arylsulfatase [Dongiaceae bacterium]